MDGNLTVAINVQGSDSFNGFDITVKTDPAVLQPVATDLSGSVLPPEGRVILVNTADPLQGTARVAAVIVGAFTPSPTTGHLFSISYQVVGSGGTALYFPAECPNSSNDSFCVTITNPNLPGGVAAENLQTATFGTVVPDFTISAIPTSTALFPGGSAKSTILLASTGGFTGPVDLSTSPPPLCITCPSWFVSPTQVNLESGGSGTSSLTFSTVPSTSPGSWTVTVTGASGSSTHSVNIHFVIVPPPAPDFGIGVQPSMLTLTPGDSATSSVSLVSLLGFSGDIALSTNVSPGGATALVDPDMVYLLANGTAASVLTVSTTDATPLGMYSVQVTGVSGSITHSTFLALNVVAQPIAGMLCVAAGDTLSCPPTPSTFEGMVGSQLVVSINVQNSEGLNGFDVTVAADPAVLQPVSASLDGTLLQNPLVLANTVVPVTGTARVAAVSIGFISSAPTTGRFFAILYNIVGPSDGTPIGFSGVIVTNPNLPGGVVQESLQGAMITVPAPDFAISAVSQSLTISHGQSAYTTITLESLAGFSGQVTLSVLVDSSNPILTSVRRQPSATLDPSSVSLTPEGSTSTLTVFVPRSAAPGLYVLTITATDGTISHTATITVTVPPRH